MKHIKGENIRIIRILKGIKIETMAKQLGISKGEYSKIENNQRKNISKYIDKILILLEIEEEHLIEDIPINKLLLSFKE